MLEALSCIALAVYFEARGEPLAGQLAVAQVIINRVNDKSYPDNVCDVIRQGPVSKRTGQPIRHRCQFSFWCDGKPERVENYDAWQTAVRVAEMAVWLNKSDHPVDVSEGATLYHSINVSPPWRYTVRTTVRIGNHIFYRR